MAEILVVDDDVDSCRALVRLFEKAGHTSVAAFGGQEALSLVQALRFHLVLLDLRMPVVGGMEVLRSIRADPATRDTPVVIFSGEGSEAAQDQARALGANSYVHKPVRWGELYGRVAPFIGGTA